MEIGLCIEMALTSLPFEQRFAKAADLGFKNVEMWFVKDFSYNGSPEHLSKLADKAGVSITNTVIGSPDGSLGGGLVNPSNRSQWLERAEMTLQFNKKAGIPATIVCTGNIAEEMSPAQMMESVREGLKPTLDLAERAGITLLLEPLNTKYDHPGYFCRSSGMAAEICRYFGSHYLKILFDCYHMQIMEGDLVNNIKKNMDVIGHFHAAGVPGRHEIHISELNYRYIINQIISFGYKGVFGLEYEPILDDEDSLRKTLEYLI